MKTTYQFAALASALISSSLVLAQNKSYDFSAPAPDPNPAPTTVIVSVVEETPADVTVTIDEPSGGFPTYTPPPAAPAASSPSSVAVPAPPPASASGPSSSAPASKPSAGGTISINGTHASCGPGCAMSVSFTGMNVPFAVGAGQANIMSGMTREVCLCFEPGSTRVVIGTTDTGKMATLFEGSASGDTGYLDVSFVQGYTYPMVCAGQGGTSGCSTDLYSVPGAICPGGGGTKMGEVCNNPQGPAGKRNPGAPPADGNSPTASPWCEACSAPDPFFAPCSGGGYTYPYDDIDAMEFGTEITCCIGPQCEQKEGVPAKSDKGNCKSGDVAIRKDPCIPCPGTGSCTVASSKRDLEELVEHAAAEKRSMSHLRHHRHRHAAAHGHKH